MRHSPDAFFASAPAAFETPSPASLMTPAYLPPLRPFYNRVASVMWHVPWYSINGQIRLTEDIGVSRATISRLVRGRSMPGYLLMQDVTRALQTRLGRPLDLRELFSTDGTYPTPSVCTLVGCQGCLPRLCYNEKTDCLHPQYEQMRPGQWEASVQVGAIPPTKRGGEIVVRPMGVKPSV